jgi:RHS repeat-associated protein
MIVMHVRTVAALLAASVVLATVVSASAQGTPGNAPGSQTGDTGAAYTGLASVPEANLFTGIAQTSIPIEVPPGRLGLAPVLALAYSSNAGPGSYGHGWSMPLPRVHRSLRRGVPRYDETDTFVLEMPGALVDLEPVPGSANGYRAEIESGFFRIGFDRSNNSWKVIDKLGVTFTFGTASSSRTGRSPDTSGTFAWLLDRVEDAAGNRIDFQYRQSINDTGSTGLPQRIRYGANVRTGQSHFAEVLFEWTIVAGAVRVSWHEGYPDRFDVRLASISTHTHELPARRYDFSFAVDPVSTDLRLAGVTLTAFGEAPGDDVQLPSTVFVYARAVHDGWPMAGDSGAGARPYEIEAVGDIRLGRNAVTLDNVDLNGDAIADRIEISSLKRVWLGTGRGFEPAGTWNWPTHSTAPRSVRKSESSGRLLSNVFDLDGDSFADLVETNVTACNAPVGHWCVWRGSSAGFASSAIHWRSPAANLRETESGGSKVLTDLLDMDADGRLDLVDATHYDENAAVPAWNVHRNTGNGFATTPVPFAAPVPFLSRAKNGRTTHGLFDINADSLPDLVVADLSATETVSWNATDRWQVYFHDGSGLAAEPVLWRIDGVASGVGLPNFLNLRAGDGSTTADLFDITGDGRPDLVRRTRFYEPETTGIPLLCTNQGWCSLPDTDDSAVSNGNCCFNLLVFVNTGSSFSQPVRWASPAHGLRADHERCPYDSSLVSCTFRYVYDFDLFDVDGDGLVDFVERHTSGGKPLSWLVHPHPASASAGRARPNVLVAMRNGVGGETMLRYRAAAGTPDTRLPNAHWVVAERELRDSIYDQAPIRTSFAYRGGAFDVVRREMRGFAVVQETDAAGNLRVREYHQDRRRAGRLRRTTNLGAPPCTATDPDDPNDPCSPWKSQLGFTEYEWPSSGPVLVTRESDVPIHAGSIVENLRRTSHYSYDAFGNITRRSIETPMAATTTTTTGYVHRVSDQSGGIPGVYHVSKPAHVVVEEADRPVPLVERRFEYEWKSPAGALLSSATCMTWNIRDCVRWSTRNFEYERNGNVVVAQAPDGATSRTTWDASAHFAVKSVDPIGLVTTSVTDPRTGLVTETVTPGGSRLRARFDGLGRLLRSWGPGTTKASPLRRFEYAPGDLGDSPPRIVVHDALTGSQATFFDGLGRNVASKKQSLDGNTPVSIVSGLKLYDERALVVAETLPFESSDLDVDTLSEQFEDATAWMEFGHDEVARLVTTRGPDGATTVVDRSSPGILRTEDPNVTRGVLPGTVTLDFFDGLGRRLLRDSCAGKPSASKPYQCRAGALLRRESWTYDGLGRVVESRTHGLGVAAGDSVTVVERDGLGNRTSVFHSNAGTWHFESDDNGRPTEVLKPDGTLLTTSYDHTGRIRRRRGPTSRANYSYHKDGGGIGKLRKVTTRSRSMRVTEMSEYDDRGRIEARDRRVAVRNSSPGHILVRYRYDDLDRRLGTIVDGWGLNTSEVTTGYGALGRENFAGSGEQVHVAGSLHDAEGRLRRIDFGNGVSDFIGYEARSVDAKTSGHLRCLRSALSTSSSGSCDAAADDLQAMHYVDYDGTGRLLQLDDASRETGDPLFASRSYEYDALGRLAAARHGSSAEVFAFDPIGNLTRKGGAQFDYLEADRPSQIARVRTASGEELPFEYDVNGRRVSDGDRTYVYDDWDRLVEVWSAGELVTSYGYSDTGERIFTRGLDGTELEMGDGIRFRGDRIERTITFSGRPVAVERYYTAQSGRARPREVASPDVVFLHLDHQQSVTMVTDPSGRAVEYRRYRPFGDSAGLFDGGGTPADTATTRYAFTSHAEDPDAGLLFLGARHYDPASGSFLTLDPGMQFASPYAYSDGNPISGRDPDGKLWQLGAMELLTLAVGTATFIDSIVRTGDLGHSLTAGVFAGFSVYVSSQLSTAIAKPFATGGHTWLQTTLSVASSGLQTYEAAEAIEDGRYAGGILTAGMLAASLIGIETAFDPGAGTTPGETQERHGIKDRGMMNGRQVMDVDGVCATRPGCASNTIIALRENFRVLFTGTAGCVGGCDQIATAAQEHIANGKNVLLRCNSFGSIKCLGALQQHGLAPRLNETDANGVPRLAVEMSGTPLLRPPAFKNVTYQVNLFDPVTWVGTAYSIPHNSDVVLGKNWWVPAPLIVHHTRMYEKPFHEALGEMIP